MPDQVLTNQALNRALLARQMLLSREDVSPLQAIERLAGLQAQQARPPFVGLWTRLKNFQRESLLELIQRHEAVRATWIRGTLHLIGADDYASFRAAVQLALTAGVNSILRERATALDPPALLSAARKFLHGTPKTFTELRTALMQTFPDGEERAMGYFVRMNLPLVAAPDNAEWGYSGDSPFTPAEPWLNRDLNPNADPAALVLRYLAAFGPATPADAQAWSGIPKLKEVFASLKPQLQIFRDERKRELFDLPGAPRPSEDTPVPVRFLPAFDNTILSHTDRRRIIADEHRPRVATKNLLILPTFLIDGFVAGIWSTTCQKGTATLNATPFAAIPQSHKKKLMEEAEKLVRFAEPAATKFQVQCEAPK